VVSPGPPKERHLSETRLPRLGASGSDSSHGDSGRKTRELLGANAPWQNRSQTKKKESTLNTKLRILPATRSSQSSKSPTGSPVLLRMTC
jgi:hypothetical protein